MYLLCSNIRGGWSAPEVVRLFVTAMAKAPSTELRQKEAARFLEAISSVASRYETHDKLYHAQFKDGKLDAFCSALSEEYQKTIDSEIRARSEADSRGNRLVVVFDEAKVLDTDEKDDVSSSYRCIRSMLNPCNMIGVFIDTSGQLATLTPSGATSDRAANPTSGIGTLVNPFFEIDSFDLFDDHLFFLGRPLWKRKFESRLNQDYDELVTFAAHKLAGDHGEENDRFLALFLCRFGLDPTFDLAERLIGSHMATLFDMTVDRKKLVSGYRSEPILAEASAYQTTSKNGFRSRMLKTVRHSLNNRVVHCHKVDRGEVAAAAWIGLSLDDLRWKTNPNDEYSAAKEGLSRAVPTVEFLNELGCNLADDVVEELRHWWINSTHFSRPAGSPDRGILKTCWKRHAGLYMTNGEEGIDLLMDMKQCNEDIYSTVRIQVKNYKSMITANALKGLFGKLDVQRCTPVATFEEEPFSIAIVVQVENGGIEASSMIQELGRPTRRTASTSCSTARQLQIGCQITGPHKEDLQGIAGDAVENVDFVGSSFMFRNREWYGWSDDAVSNMVLEAGS